jgi:hypothetical protein
VPTLLSSEEMRTDYVFEPCIFHGATATASHIPWQAFSAQSAKKEEVVVICPYFVCMFYSEATRVLMNFSIRVLSKSCG